MAETKAPRRKSDLDPVSESWRKLPWRKLEQHAYRIQKRIFKAEERGNQQAVRHLQKLLMKSRAARLIAVRRVTQDNQGKRTAGIDGVKSVHPKQRFAMVEKIHPKEWKHRKARPVRRVYIPKPGKDEKRPLGIPVMQDRAQQALVKSALEPAWEAKFEPNSYGFRPGRSCHDAIGAIFTAISKKDKYVLDADIKGCFDHIDHAALLKKLGGYPGLNQVCKAWLKAGILTEGVFEPTEKGTPQGGVVSPLLANIALHGMETAVRATFTFREGKPNFIRYADDFVVLHPTEEGVIKARAIVEAWLKDMGLELKPSKTRITHTLRKYQGTTGFDFLGFTIRQFLVGKTHSGRPGGVGKNALLGFKTIIKPSKEAIKQHRVEIRQILKKNKSASQEKLMRDLNPVIRGWTYYYRPVAASETFKSCDYVLFHQLETWATRRHPHKSKHWIREKYWGVDKGEGWKFQTQETYLYKHTLTHIQRHVKVRGKASPYDGNLLYWSTRLRAHPAIGSTRGKVLQRQQGKCKWCGLKFKDGDSIELDHHIPRSLGGKNEMGNLMALHLHCHDQRHANSVRGINENDHRTEEPDEGKAFTSGSEDE